MKKRPPELPGGLFVLCFNSQFFSSLWFSFSILLATEITPNDALRHKSILTTREPSGHVERILSKDLEGEAMFCEQCGSQLQVGAQYCARCGKQLAGRVQLAYPSRNRVQEHIRLLGILWMALSAVNVLGGGVLLVVANTLFARWNQFPSSVHPMFLRPLLSFIGVLILAKALAGFLAGYGLLQRESWARILALILGFISLFNIPFGTALGIYTLWVLLPAASDEEYRALSRAA